jgi:hypothetical protein
MAFSKSKNPAFKRDYQREDKYEDTPIQIKHREERNKARADIAKTRGKAVSSNRDVAHIKPLAGGGSNTRANVRVESIAKNRSWRKGQHGYKVPVDK